MARIVDAAARIFDERGYRATTTNEVAAAAGVSIGSLYQYFPHKDALLAALAERHLDAASDAFTSRLGALRRERPPIDVVVRALVELAVELNDPSTLHRVLFVEAPRTPEVRRRLDQLTADVAAEVARHLRRVGHRPAAAERRARLLVAMTDAAVHDVVLAAPPGRSRARLVDDLVTQLLDGLVTPSR